MLEQVRFFDFRLVNEKHRIFEIKLNFNVVFFIYNTSKYIYHLPIDVIVTL